jgi:hypothetical protein
VLEETAGELLDVDEVISPARVDPAELAERAAQLDVVLAMVAGLSPLHRRVLAEWLVGRTDREIAAGLGKPTAVIKGLRNEMLISARSALASAGFSVN